MPALSQPLKVLAARSSSASASSGGLSVGVIVGIVVAGVLIVILAGGAFYLVRRQRRQRSCPSKMVMPVRSCGQSSWESSHVRKLSSETAGVAPLLSEQPSWLQTYQEKDDASSSFEAGFPSAKSLFISSDEGGYVVSEQQSYAISLSDAIPPKGDEFLLDGAHKKFLLSLSIPSGRMSSYDYTFSTPRLINKALQSPPPSPTPSTPSSASSESMYSTMTASTNLHRLVEQTTPLPPVPPMPSYLKIEEDSLHRSDTEVIGQLLKSRADRVGDAPAQSLSHAERIERTGSITSISSFSSNGRSSPPRPRSQVSGPRPLKRKSNKAPIVPMETLMEDPDSSAPVLQAPVAVTPLRVQALQSSPAPSASRPIPLAAAFRTSIPSGSTSSSSRPTIIFAPSGELDQDNEHPPLSPTAPLNISSSKKATRGIKLRIDTQFDAGTVTPRTATQMPQDYLTPVLRSVEVVG